jgi:hypothetical protein
MLDAVGRVVPAGQTVRKLDLVAAVTVTFRTTAETPVAGTPDAAGIARLMLPPAAIGPWRTPLPIRVSRTRAGATL